MRSLVKVVSFVLIALVAPAPRAQDLVRAGPADTTAEIRIQLPPGSKDEVAVEPHDRRVVLELPRGSMFPLDFEASSGGLIREGEVEPLGQTRVRVELTLAAGYLERVTFEPDALVLRFQSSFGAHRGPTDPEEDYRLGADDKIVVTVHNHPELTTTLTISREGTITAPLIGELQAEGKSPTELSEHIAERLGRSYLVDPKVDVAVEDYRSQWVMVTGEVPLAGRVPLRGGTRLKEVLSEAGGFRDQSGKEIVISRKVNGADDYVTITVDREDFEAGVSDPMLQHGDIVEVAKAEYCYIHGEVRSPGRVPIERQTTLLKAITMVGGLTEWADRKTVKILYPEGDARGEMVVNLKRVQAGREADPVLEGGEVIVIKRRFF